MPEGAVANTSATLVGKDARNQHCVNEAHSVPEMECNCCPMLFDGRSEMMQHKHHAGHYFFHCQFCIEEDDPRLRYRIHFASSFAKHELWHFWECEDCGLYPQAPAGSEFRLQRIHLEDSVSIEKDKLVEHSYCVKCDCALNNTDSRMEEMVCDSFLSCSLMLSQRTNTHL